MRSTQRFIFGTIRYVKILCLLYGAHVQRTVMDNLCSNLCTNICVRSITLSIKKLVPFVREKCAKNSSRQSMFGVCVRTSVFGTLLLRSLLGCQFSINCGDRVSEICTLGWTLTDQLFWVWGLSWTFPYLW